MPRGVTGPGQTGGVSHPEWAPALAPEKCWLARMQTQWCHKKKEKKKETKNPHLSMCLLCILLGTGPWPTVCDF